MHRQTSIDAYDAVKRSGWVNKSRMAVYDVIFHRGPLTQSEIEAEIALTTGRKNVTSFHKRVSELEKLKLVYPALTRPCRVTGRNAIAWDVTSNGPTQPPPHVSWRKKFEDAERRLKALEQQLAAMSPQMDLIPPDKSIDGLAHDIQRLFLVERKPLVEAVRIVLRGDQP